MLSSHPRLSQARDGRDPVSGGLSEPCSSQRQGLLLMRQGISSLGRIGQNVIKYGTSCHLAEKRPQTLRVIWPQFLFVRLFAYFCSTKRHCPCPCAPLDLLLPEWCLQASDLTELWVHSVGVRLTETPGPGKAGGHCRKEPSLDFWLISFTVAKEQEILSNSIKCHLCTS